MKTQLLNEQTENKSETALYLEKLNKRAETTINRVNATLNDKVTISLKDSVQTEKDGFILLSAKVEVSSDRIKEEFEKATGINTQEVKQSGNSAKDFLINQSLANQFRKTAHLIVKQ